MKYSLDLILRDENRAFSWFEVCFENCELLKNFLQNRITRIFDFDGELPIKTGCYDKGKKIYLVDCFEYEVLNVIKYKISIEEVVKNGSSK